MDGVAPISATSATTAGGRSAGRFASDRADWEEACVEAQAVCRQLGYQLAGTRDRRRARLLVAQLVTACAELVRLAEHCGALSDAAQQPENE